MKKNAILTAAICIVAVLLLIVVISNITGDGSVNLSFKQKLMHTIWDAVKIFW